MKQVRVTIRQVENLEEDNSKLYQNPEITRDSDILYCLYEMNPKIINFAKNKLILSTN